MTTSLPHAAQGGLNRAVPEPAGTPQNNAQSPVPAEPDWITVVEAQAQFRSLGLPRSVEAIRKYCRQGKLEAEVIAGPKGDQHMIQRGSIDVFVAEQLKVLEAASRSIPVRDGTTRQLPVQSVTYRDAPEQPGTARDDGGEVKKLGEEIEQLKRTNRDLEIDKEVRTRMNDMLEKNNDRLIGQLREVSQEAQEWSRKYGQLEERVQHLQLAAPSPAAVVSEQAQDAFGARNHVVDPMRDVQAERFNDPADPPTNPQPSESFPTADRRTSFPI